ncbi:MAG: hypothetical protein ACLU9S_02535 [Oscillospiraceae bacterium]
MPYFCRFHRILLAACLGGFLSFGLCRLCLPLQYTATGSLYVSIPGSELQILTASRRCASPPPRSWQNDLSALWQLTGC